MVGKKDRKKLRKIGHRSAESLTMWRVKHGAGLSSHSFLENIV